MDANEPRCMFCKKPIAVETVMSMCERRWVRDEFMPHLASIRVAVEKNLLVHDQEDARRILEVRALRAKYNKLPTIKSLRRRLRLPNGSHPEIDRVRADQHDLREKIRALTGTQDTTRSPTNTDSTSIMFCPIEKCRGIIRNTDGCGLCGQKVCMQCGEPSHDDQDCNETTLLNFRAIRSETMPCPGCSVRIYQISGCDQMWCVMCHTCFSWKTGEKMGGAVHNPHYYEWLFRHTTTAHDIDPCGEIPDALLYLSYMQSRGYQDVHTYMKMHRMLTHLREVCMFRLRADRVPNNRELRIQYMTGDINETRWAELLQHREQRRLKINAMYLVTEMLVNVLSDLVRRSIAASPDHNSIKKEFHEIMTYSREQYETICRIHGGRLIPSLYVVYNYRA